MRTDSKIKIILADDHPLMRQAIRLQLEKDEDMKVVAEARDGKEALSLIASLKPDVVILDISMPKLNGLETTKQISSLYPGTKVIIFTVHADNGHIQGLLQAGAKGYLTKNVPGEEVVHAVRSVVSGEQVVLCPSTEINDDEIESIQQVQSVIPQLLTPRELKILKFVANGLTNKEISANLSISLRGVKAILTAIYIKLGAVSRTDAISIGLKSGILSLNDLERSIPYETG